jgi:hypothetical protein
MRFIVFPGALAEAPIDLGAKAGYLADLIAAGHDDIAIPPWFVLLPTAFDASLDPTLVRQLLGREPDWASFEELRPADSVLQEIADAWRVLGAPAVMAVRASPVETDSDFAAVYDSFCPVLAAALPDRIADIWRSAFGEEALDWHHLQGRSGAKIPAIMVQARLKAQFCGGALSADPRDGHREQVILSAIGGGTDLWQEIEQGEMPADHPEPDFYRFEKGQKVTLSHPDGVLKVCQCQQIVDLVCRLERFFGWPVDIDWAIQDNILYLLQVRLLRHLPDNIVDTEKPVEYWQNLADDFPMAWRAVSGFYAARLNHGWYLGQKIIQPSVTPVDLFADIEGLLCVNRLHIAAQIGWFTDVKNGRKNNDWAKIGLRKPPQSVLPNPIGFWQRKWFLWQVGRKIPMMLDQWQTALMPWLLRIEASPDLHAVDRHEILTGLQSAASIGALLPIALMIGPAQGAWRERAASLERRYLNALAVIIADAPASKTLPSGAFCRQGKRIWGETYQSIRFSGAKTFLSTLIRPIMAVFDR